MAELGFRMISNVDFCLLPVPLIIPDFFAVFHLRLNFNVMGSVAFEWSDPESSNTAKAKL
jgi:hypothetical protein